MSFTLSETKSATIGANETEKILELNGEGKNLFLHCFSNNSNMRFTIKADKVALKLGTGDYFSTANLNPWGYDSGLLVRQLVYNAVEGNDNLFIITIPFRWLKNLEIIVTNISVANRDAVVSIIYEVPIPEEDVQRAGPRPDPVM